jgi:outer membrane protein assembly factor BamB
VRRAPVTLVLSALVLAGTAATATAADRAHAGRPDDRPCPGGPPCGPKEKRPAACSDRQAAGGEWRGLNADHANSRHQPAEDRIGVAEAPGLRPAWSFDAADHGIPGGTRSTPVVAGGCVFVAFGQGYLGDRGDVVALDADTGQLVWKARLEGSVLGLAVRDGLVYVTPSKGTRGEVQAPVVTEDYAPAGSFAVALDASTGDVRWTSERLDDGTAGNGTFITASPVVYEAGGRHLVFVPLAGGAGDGARVPMWFLDARTGATVKRALSLSEAEYAAGFGGTGIWSTAAFDAATGHLYAGTADSDGRSRQHPYNNALLKVDGDPRRSTFGTVVAHYEGVSEHADLDRAGVYPESNPTCGALGDLSGRDLPTFFDTSAAVDCGELDLDFGASPNLVATPDGLLVTAMQKAGVFHAVSASAMERAWAVSVGPGGPASHSATAAVDAAGIAVGATPNAVLGLDAAAGGVRWASATGVELFAYQPLTAAGGVLYAVNDTGSLLALDGGTGLPLLQRDIALDGGFGQCLGVGAGVAVALHTVFAPCDAGGTVDLAGVTGNAGGLVAYRLG